MSLHDELTHLTSAQPAQPGDRLSSVTGKARRMKRTRNALVLAAVIGVAAPAGVLAATIDRSPAKVDYAASPTTWPDRSQPKADRAVADTALVAWQEEGNVFGTQRWLYRGTVLVPGGTPQYVVAFVADDTLVVGHGVLKDKDESGNPQKPVVDGWQLKATDATTAPPVLSLYLMRLDRETLDDNWLFALAAPRSRTLTWDATPVPFAPTGTVEHGSLHSTDGVFQGWTGRLAGRLTAHVGDATTPLTFPDGDPHLTPVTDGPAFSAATSILGGAGQLDESSESVGYADDSAQGRATLRLRCYGGGRASVVLEGVGPDNVIGSALCDDQEHTVALPAARGQRLLRLQGHELQVYTFTIDRA